MKNFLIKAGKFIRENIFPLQYTCDLCGIEIFSGNLCADCLKKVTFNDGTVCPVCGRKTFRPEICLECKANAPIYDRAVSAIVYENSGVALISRFKQGRAYLAEYFSDLISKKLNTFEDFDCIVCVPMTDKALKRRGYNQTEKLAKALSKRVNKPFLSGALSKKRDTYAQKGLSRRDRVKNLESSFKVEIEEDLKDKIVLVIDDVLTTGATLDEISRVLKSAGAKKVYAATVASVEYKSPDRKDKDN